MRICVRSQYAFLRAKNKKPPDVLLTANGVPGAIRTRGLSLRRRTLYPAELREQVTSRIVARKRGACKRPPAHLSCRSASCSGFKIARAFCSSILSSFSALARFRRACCCTSSAQASASCVSSPADFTVSASAVPLWVSSNMASVFSLSVLVLFSAASAVIWSMSFCILFIPLVDQSHPCIMIHLSRAGKQQGQFFLSKSAVMPNDCGYGRQLRGRHRCGIMCRATERNKT